MKKIKFKFTLFFEKEEITLEGNQSPEGVIDTLKLLIDKVNKENNTENTRNELNSQGNRGLTQNRIVEEVSNPQEQHLANSSNSSEASVSPDIQIQNEINKDYEEQ